MPLKPTHAKPGCRIKPLVISRKMICPRLILKRFPLSRRVKNTHETLKSCF